MYRKEVNERSPLRVFEKSIHGGLGRGNVGVIVSRPGVGKTALLVQIALDDLMRERNVLHISHEHPVDHVRSYYDEIFHDLVITYRLSQPQNVRLEIERHRLLYSHLSHASSAPPSMRAGASSLTKIEETLGFATGTAHFAPDAVIIDGFDFENATHEAVGRLSEIAQELSVEMWLSAKTDEYTEGPPSTMAAPTSTPTPLRRFFDDLAVIVLLQPHDDEIELRLLKDHDNPDLSELTLSLDPTTMRVVDEDLPVGGGVPTDPGSYTLIGGGARGAEAEFGACAERAGVNERHYSFDGHPFLERDRGVLVLSEDDLSKGDFSLVYVSHRLGRPMTQIPNIKRILQTVWHQITAANQVFVVGTITESGTVRGGTGWGAELARLWSKPLYVFDQVKGSWFHWDTTRWDAIDTPQITSRLFAGIGTTNITQEGRQAIRQLFDNSFNGGKSS